MATRLLKAGIPLVVWNRTPERCGPLAELGASVASSVEEVFDSSRIVMLMLLDERAVDAVLLRDGEVLPAVQGRTLVMLGTTSARCSAALAEKVRSAGGTYVEAPVSGSRVPAEEGTLIGMLAADPRDLDAVEPLLAALCRSVVRCGEVPSALRTKLAVNHYLIVLVAALAEAFTAAEAAGVDRWVFANVLDAGPMASPVSRIKLAKLVADDFSAQASIRDVAEIAKLVHEQATIAGAQAPLMQAAAALFQDALARGLADLDMAAVLRTTPS